jgi:ornithine carbamoyltransferase
VLNADVIFSDKVISLNDKVNKKIKVNDFKNFRVSKKLMNYAKKIVLFYIVYQEGQKLMMLYLKAKTQKFGCKL